MVEEVKNKSTMDIEEAISIVDTCLNRVIGVTKNKIQNIRLEEFGLSGNNWKVTLSYVVEKNTTPSTLSSLYGSNLERLYKTFIVDSSSKEVVSMMDKK